MSKSLRYSLVIAFLVNMTSLYSFGQEKGAPADAPRGERPQRARGGRPGMQGGGPAIGASRVPAGQVPPADMARWGWGPQEAINAESQDVILIATHMYGLAGQDSTSLEKSVAVAQEARWHPNGVNEKYEAILERRAAIFNKITGGQDIGANTAEVSKLLNDNPEFVETNNQISKLESNRELNLAEFIPVIEASLPPHLVDLARQNWADRAAKISELRLKNRTLGMQLKAGSYEATMAATSVTHPWVPKAADMSHEERLARHLARNGNEKRAVQPRRPIEQKPVALGGQGNAKPVTKSNVTTTPPTTKGTPAAVARPVGKPAVNPQGPATPPRPLSEWEKYVLEFIDKHQLTETQKNAALGILRDMTARANQIQKANESRFKAAESIQDPKVKSEKMRELTAPIDGLFERLKARLELLLTAQQRDQVAAPAKPNK